MAIDDKIIAELKATHGEVHLVEHDGAEVVVRAPKREVWKRFRGAMADEQKRPEAFETLLRDCCVHPSREELAQLLEARPGLGETFGGKVAEIGGLAKNATSRKL